MKDGVHDVRTPGLPEALSAPLAGSAWEVLRRFGRAADASEVASALGSEPGTIRETLDALSEAGILEKLPIRAHRRQPTYRANGEVLAVAYEPDDPVETEAAKGIATAFRSQVQSAVLREEHSPHAAMLGAWRSVQLEPEERAELRRLLQEVLDFLESTQARITRTDGPAASTANLHLLLDLCLATGSMPPVPAIHFVPRARAEHFNGSSVAVTMQRLSPREREVAVLLANGQSRPEIARKLEVSGNTVATITKRIYAKLGVRRRVELSNRIRRGT